LEIKTSNQRGGGNGLYATRKHGIGTMIPGIAKTSCDPDVPATYLWIHNKAFGVMNGDPSICPHNNVGSYGLAVMFLVNEANNPNCHFRCHSIVVHTALEPGDELTVDYGKDYQRNYSIEGNALHEDDEDYEAELWELYPTDKELQSVWAELKAILQECDDQKAADDLHVQECDDQKDDDQKDDENAVLGTGLDEEALSHFLDDRVSQADDDQPIDKPQKDKKRKARKKPLSRKKHVKKSKAADEQTTVGNTKRPQLDPVAVERLVALLPQFVGTCDDWVSNHLAGQHIDDYNLGGSFLVSKTGIQKTAFGVVKRNATVCRLTALPEGDWIRVEGRVVLAGWTLVEVSPTEQWLPSCLVRVDVTEEVQLWHTTYIIDEHAVEDLEDVVTLTDVQELEDVVAVGGNHTHSQLLVVVVVSYTQTQHTPTQ